MGVIYSVPTADFVQKTLSAQLTAGTTAAATLNNVTSIPNLSGVMIVDRVDTNGVETPNAVEVIAYSGTSGSTVVTLTRGLAGTSDQNHAVGAIVEFGPDILWAQSVIDALSQVVSSTTGLPLYTTNVMKPTAPYIAVGSDATGDMYYRSSGGTLSRLGLGTTGQVLTANASLPYWATSSAGGGSGTAFWSALPTTPAWVSTNQMSIDDVSNANKYDILFQKGTLFKWDDGSYRNAMSLGASYASNKVYVGLMGSTLTTMASLPIMKYAIPEISSIRKDFIIPGTLTAGTDYARNWHLPDQSYILGVDTYLKSGGSGATYTVFDVNANSTSILSANVTNTLRPFFQTLATTSLNIPTLNPDTVVAQNAVLSIDIDSVNQTAPQESYNYIYYYPAGWRYRS